VVHPGNPQHMWGQRPSPYCTLYGQQEKRALLISCSVCKLLSQS
jgi:hypothetical protein